MIRGEIAGREATVRERARSGGPSERARGRRDRANARAHGPADRETPDPGGPRREPYAGVEAVEHLGQHGPVVSQPDRVEQIGEVGCLGRGPQREAEPVVRVVQAAQRVEHEHAVRGCEAIHAGYFTLMHAVEMAEIQRGERLVPVHQADEVRFVDGQLHDFAVVRRVVVDGARRDPRPPVPRPAGVRRRRRREDRDIHARTVASTSRSCRSASQPGEGRPERDRSLRVRRRGPART